MQFRSPPFHICSSCAPGRLASINVGGAFGSKGCAPLWKGLYSLSPNGAHKMANSVAIHKSFSIFEQMRDVQDRIMRRAYEIFEQNGRPFGNDLNDWLIAERELCWKPAVE